MRINQGRIAMKRLLCVTFAALLLPIPAFAQKVLASSGVWRVTLDNGAGGPQCFMYPDTPDVELVFFVDKERVLTVGFKPKSKVKSHKGSLSFADEKGTVLKLSKAF